MFKDRNTQARNPHPTVKPLDLMRWLVRLVTPPGGTVLDPFAGSGTTGCACAMEGVDAVLIEREAEYLPIIEGRVAHWQGVAKEEAAAAARAGDIAAPLAPLRATGAVLGGLFEMEEE
jgi:site-specific DNA-methyltransferase (adenine-specific)